MSCHSLSKNYNVIIKTVHFVTFLNLSVGNMVTSLVQRPVKHSINVNKIYTNIQSIVFISTLSRHEVSILDV